MKELQESFIGRGQVRGFKFTQIKKNDYAYIYEVNSGSFPRYEVFHRKENSQFNCISYPSNKAFGIWAWSCKTLERALERFEDITEVKINQ